MKIVFQKLRDFFGWFRFQWEVRPVVVVGLVLLLGAAAVLWALRQPLRERARQWAAADTAERAKEAAAAGDWGAAEEAARKSLRDSGSIESLRILVKALRQDGDPEARAFAANLFRHAEATAADRTEALAIALDAGDIPLAGAMVQRLPPEEVETDLDLRIEAVRFWMEAGDFGRGVKLADAEASAGRRADFDLLVAAGLLRRGDERLRDEILRRIVRILRQPDREPAVGALRLLASLPDQWIAPELGALAVQRLGNDPTLEAPDRLLVELFRWVLEPLGRELLVTSAVGAFRDEHLGPLTAWLLRIGEAQQVVDLTEPGDHPEGMPIGVFTNRMLALVRLDRLETVEMELKEEVPESYPPAEVLAYRAGVAQSLGKDAESLMLWKRTLDTAERDSEENQFYRLAAIAARTGSGHRQMEALAKAIEHPRAVLPQARDLQALFAWLYREGDTERLLEISYQLLQREPGNPQLANNYHYLRALHADPAPDAAEILGKLIESFPEEITFRGTLAFVLLRTGDAAGALATLDELDRAPEELPPTERTVYAAALAALDRREEAEALAAQIDWSALSEAEAAVLRPLTNPPEEEEDADRNSRPKAGANGA